MNDNGGVRVPRNRFFFCTFSGIDPSGELRTGKVMCKTTTGRHIAERFVINLITKDFALRNVYVTHVYEMSESDFHDFNEGMDDIPDATEDTSFL